MCQKAADEFVGSDAFSVGVEICFDAMAKYRRGDGADIVDADVHTPLDDSTRAMVDAAMLGRMKESAYFINAARGGIVVQEDLKAALT